MDEASQVDVATGALALSCARNVVIVGDTKQLPNMVGRKIKDMLQEKTAKDFLKYRHDGRTSHLTGRNKNMGWK